LSFETSDSVFSTSDINKMYNSFLNSFLRIFYSSFPLKELTINSNSNTWITPGIKISCRHKRDLYLLYRTSNDEALKNHCRLSCKILKDVIREAKRQHHNRQVSNSCNKTRAAWDIVRSVTSDKTIQEFELNGKVIRNRQNIADFLNNFFLSALLII
jgi:hypothetical protein